METSPVKEDTPKQSSMSFYDALREIFDGKRVTRLAWGNSDYCFMRDEQLFIHIDGKDKKWIIQLADNEDDWVVA